jgi:hypothetical protein
MQEKELNRSTAQARTRWQSAHEVARELRWVAQNSTAPASDVGAVSRRWLSLASGVAVVLAAVALILAAKYYAARPVPRSPLMVSRLPPEGVFPDPAGRNGPPKISPDGNRLAFVGCKTAAASSSVTGGKLCSIWTRSLHSTDAHEVAGTSGGYFPFWTPDGGDIAFFADGKATKAIRDTFHSWKLPQRSDKAIEDLSRMFNPVIRGWFQYYGRYYRSPLYPTMRKLDRDLVLWASRKYKKLRHRGSRTRWCAGRRYFAGVA